MKSLKDDALNLSDFGNETVNVSEDATLVHQGDLVEGRLLPLLVEPAVDDVDLVEWGRTHVDVINDALHERGGILFRGFELDDLSAFEAFIEATSGSLLTYEDGSSPRSQVQGNVYTSTDHPASQEIFMHSELSYAHTWPMKLFFYCDVPADVDGRTPLADTRKILERIPEAIVERFEDKGVRYVRNLGTGLGLSWQQAFQTEDRGAVEAYCESANLDYEWVTDDHLRTTAHREAVREHPTTGERVWFNHAAFFHVSTLEASTREVLLAEYGTEGLPNNTFYGDGTPIEDETVATIREAYRAESIRFDWTSGDLVVLDNMLTAHGREPYEGDRNLLAGMSEPMTEDAV